MSRWRPPAPKSSPYITSEGYKKLEQESAELWEKRAEVTAALAAAAAEGDRSENAEYIYRKKQLREIDRRIGYLQRRMPKLTIVNEPGDKEKIFFGAWVRLEKNAEEEVLHRIVGADEFDTKKEYISVDSPLAKALLGKSIDHDIVIETQQGSTEYYILEISYNL